MLTKRIYSRPTLTLVLCEQQRLLAFSYYQTDEMMAKRRMAVAEEEEEEEEPFWPEQKTSAEYFGYQPYRRYRPFSE